MSFGPTSTTKTGTNNLSGTSNLALNTQFPQVNAAGNTELNTGAGNVNSGTNFFNTLLQGNKANTTAMLQPSIDEIRQGSNNTLNAINTLMPRGGGRSSTLFNQSFQPGQQIQNLFSQGRTQAATALPQIGLQQQGLGANLFGLGNQALQAANGANVPLTQAGQQQQQMTNQLWSSLGSGVFGLLTAPLGGGTAGPSILSKLGV